MDEMDKFLLHGLRKGERGTPMAQNILFGWVLFGNAANLESPPVNISTLHSDLHLTQLIHKFWELEELAARKFFSPEESMCEKLYDDTTERASDGRFIVRLPLKKNVLIAETTTDKLYYMPHHAVVKTTSQATKLRVVFNASMKSTYANSLNDALMLGPQLKQDLFSILVRLRIHLFGIIADIEKMYRQVYVAKEDSDYQRIVWRSNPADPVHHYRLLRVTYGVAAASHLAVKSLHRAALNASNASKEVIEVIRSSFFS
ncbi:uncharacterized protein LOC126765997 [Bactrocera neohumeralis]|uniref:uncharacterized protein LOC126765997 n=1 Tax=Bactrocera neohumeralis TaxID=98809 RepID=UPI002166A5F7|nr:uncharacterized protein LOC126765997 [Bactrocera neohumeralis]